MSEDLVLEGPYTFEITKEDGSSECIHFPPGTTLNALIRSSNEVAGFTLTQEQVIALTLHILNLENLAQVGAKRIATPVPREPSAEPETAIQPEAPLQHGPAEEPKE